MVVEIRYHADGVRQLDAILERGAAFVVHEHEIQRLRRIRHGERRDQRLQQFRFSGARGARDQSVRPVLGDVQAERPVHRFSDQTRRGPGVHRPARLYLLRRRREFKQVQQTAAVRDGGLSFGRAAVFDGRQRHRHGIQPIRGHQIRHDVVDVVGDVAFHPQRAGRGGDHRLAFLRQQALVGVDAQRVDAQCGAFLQQSDHARHRSQHMGVLHDHHHRGARPSFHGLTLLLGLALIQHGGQFRNAHGHVLGGDRHGADGVLPLMRREMRQPLGERPVHAVRGPVFLGAG